MSHAHHPYFIDNDPEEGFGLPFLRGPYLHQNAKVVIMALRADIEQLRKLCNRWLNEPVSESIWRYDPLLPYVFLSVSETELHSLHDRDRQKGWLPETNLAFWVLVRASRSQAGRYLDDHLAWFAPVTFADNPTSLRVKNEVYGLQTSLGRFRPDTLDLQNPELTLETLAFKELTPQTQGRNQTLLRLRRTAETPLVESPSLWHSWPEAMLAMVAGLIEAEGEQVTRALDEIQDPLTSLSRTEQRLVSLKQLPHTADSSRASYQALVEAPLAVSAFHGGGPLRNQYQLVLNNLASHPLAAGLGLSEGSQAVATAWWLNLDVSLAEGQELSQAAPRPQKLAVLGGGPGSLSAVFELTSQPAWQQQYEITIYQLGWRLGGKMASGRNQAVASRIEEATGLHFFFGFYNNVFRLVQACYKELDRPSTAPFATWQEAFNRQNFVVLEEFYNGYWQYWQLAIPPNEEVPGYDYPPKTPWDYIQEILVALSENFDEIMLPLLESHLVQDVRAIRRVVDSLEVLAGRFGLEFAEAKGLKLISEMLAEAVRQAAELDAQIDNHFGRQHNLLSDLLKAFLKLLQFLVEIVVAPVTDLRRLWLLFELGLVNVIGMIDDGVLRNGFEGINHLDYRDWLRQHGATENVVCSAPVRALYVIYEAYVHGETGAEIPSCEGQIAAGTALHVALLTTFAYRGSVIWKPKASVGDVVIAPLYQVLKRRGVKFEFFYKINSLVPDPSGEVIDEIRAARQVTLKPGLESYNPLIEVKGLPCWPDQPLYAQIEQGEALKQERIDLESYWTPWQDVEPDLSLKRGVDFDQVLLGISVGALKTICAPMLDPATNPKGWERWQQMVNGIETIQTQTFQLWLKPQLEALGWPLASPAMGSYAEPFSALLDTSPILPMENWPPNYNPQTLFYFVGPLPDPEVIPPPDDHQFPRQESEQVKKNALTWLQGYIGHLWPYALTPSGAFNYNLLVDLNNAQGAERFNSQAWRAVINPSDRYVLAVPGSDRYRLKSDGSGFGNLYLVGDWIDNGYLNLGCSEATVISGLQAAKAISGHGPKVIGLSHITEG